MKIRIPLQCIKRKVDLNKQKKAQSLCTLPNLSYLCTRFRCYSSVVERILGKDEVPSSTLGSSSETTAEITSIELSPLSFPYDYSLLRPARVGIGGRAIEGLGKEFFCSLVHVLLPWLTTSRALYHP